MEIWGGNRAIDEHVLAPGIEAWVHARPHAGDDAGGDVHYVSACAGGKITRFAVADVSGHGASVDGFAQSLRALMRRFINTPDQSRFTRELNTEFARVAEAGIFATALLATYFAPTDQLIVVNAGHPRPMVRRARTGAWEVLDGATSDAPGIRNLPLGIIDPTEYAQFVVSLDPGDEVVVVTDSVVEAPGPSGGMLGEAGVLGVLGSMSACAPSERIGRFLEAVRAFRPDAEFQDDVTVVWIHHTGAAGPRRGLVEHLHTLGRMLGLEAV